MTDEEILHKITALEKRLDILEAFHVRLWNGPFTTGPIDGLTASCGSSLHGYSMLHNITAHNEYYTELTLEKLVPELLVNPT